MFRFWTHIDDLFLAGIKPAIDVGLSVTRVGSIAQWYGMKLVGGFYKLELAQCIELQSFSQFVADVGKETKNRLPKGLHLREILKRNLKAILWISNTFNNTSWNIVIS